MSETATYRIPLSGDDVELLLDALRTSAGFRSDQHHYTRCVRLAGMLRASMETLADDARATAAPAAEDSP